MTVSLDALHEMRRHWHDRAKAMIAAHEKHASTEKWCTCGWVPTEFELRTNIKWEDHLARMIRREIEVAVRTELTRARKRLIPEIQTRVFELLGRKPVNHMGPFIYSLVSFDADRITVAICTYCKRTTDAPRCTRKEAS